MKKLREKLEERNFIVLDIYGDEKGICLKFYRHGNYGEFFIQEDKVQIVIGHVHIDTIETVNKILGGEE